MTRNFYIMAALISTIRVSNRFSTIENFKHKMLLSYLLLTVTVSNVVKKQVHFKRGYSFFPHGHCVDTVTGHGGQGPG